MSRRSSTSGRLGILYTAFFVAALLCGCEGVGMRTIENPGRNQVIRVTSGDRLYFDLEENATTGHSWDYKCNDPDVEVTVDHVEAEPGDGRVGAPGRAEVRIRIHRGYDGPSTVRFFYRRQWEKSSPAKEFTITLYKRTGDVAFWE